MQLYNDFMWVTFISASYSCELHSHKARNQFDAVWYRKIAAAWVRLRKKIWSSEIDVITTWRQRPVTAKDVYTAT